MLFKPPCVIPAKAGIYLFLIVLILVTRFVNFNWGNGFFFHPDENNMASAVSQLSSHNFNPRFFAYGQFPLYLSYFSLKSVGLPNTFSNATYILRFWSATFSTLALVFFYLAFPSVIFLILLIFNPGLIQIAHFGTTESLLVLIFAANLYLSLKILKNPKKNISYFFIALNTGIGLSTKISSLIFLTPVFLSILFSFKHFKNKLSPILITSYLLLITFLFFLFFSPYNLIAKNEFLSSMRYETGVATGQIKVFYTNQFLKSTPYLFQFVKIFPYTSGLPVFIFSFFGLFSFFKSKKHLFIILFSVFFYFLYFGQLYAKWTRFMSPIFFVFPFLATYFFQKVKPRLLLYLLILISILPGLNFLRLYLLPDIRLTASEWIVKNIPENSIILSEAGNVINLPIINYQLSITNYDFYNLDTSPQLISNLPGKIFQSDYIIIPSRRIFKNQNNSFFPYSQKYYTSLFDGSLGFQQIKQFSIFNDENAEETWSVFDHPVIRIFRKIKPLPLEEIENLINS